MPRNAIRFVSAQPDNSHYVWQTQVYLHNFLSLGVAPSDCTALFAVEPGDSSSPPLEALLARFPDCDIRIEDDTRDETGREYPASIQPHLIEKALSDSPEWESDHTFFHDCDIVLRRLPDFDRMLDEHPSACLLSDTVGYIGYQHLHERCENIRSEKPDVPEDDLIREMCAIVGIEIDVVRANQAVSGGAQYLLRGVGIDYWGKVYRDAIALRRLFDDYVARLDLEHEPNGYVQVWTAGMWAYLWNLWLEGHETVLHPELDFVFSDGSSADPAPIVHMAGLPAELKHTHFDKVDWEVLSPLETLPDQPYLFDHYGQDTVAREYATAIHEAAGVAARGVQPMRPASKWRVLTWRTESGDGVWDVQELKLRFDRRASIVAHIESGWAGAGYEASRAFDTDKGVFWGGRVAATEGRLDELYLGVELDRHAVPIEITLTQAPGTHTARIAIVQFLDASDRWTTTQVADLDPQAPNLLLADDTPTQDGVPEFQPHDDPRILVLIASYRDPELPRTITHALAQAAYPEYVRFAICHQYDDTTVDLLAPWADDPRFSMDEVGYQESLGCCWARARTFDLYDDEPYMLQIDAHTRFAARWDVRYIEMLEATGARLPLLTTYPPGYKPQDDGTVVYDLEVGVQRLVIESLNDDLTTNQKTDIVDDPSVPGPSPSIAAGQIFTRGRFCLDVPYDPDLYSGGEEISLAARAYTSGYDLFYPNENLIWHLYNHDTSRHWDDHDDHDDSHSVAVNRLESLFLGDSRSLGRFGLGSARPLSEFEAVAGVTFARRPEPDRERPNEMPATVYVENGSLTIRIDRSVIEPRDDYRAFVVVFVDRHGNEVARRAISAPDVLDLSRADVTFHDLDAADIDRCVVVPTRQNGDFGAVQLHVIGEGVGAAARPAWFAKAGHDPRAPIDEVEAIRHLIDARRRSGEVTCFIQIGAYDGTGDAFQEEFLWSGGQNGLCGVLVEPSPGPFERLAHRVADAPGVASRTELLNVGIDANGRNGVGPLFVVDEVRVLREWSPEVLERHGIRTGFFEQVSSFDHEHVARHIDKYRAELSDLETTSHRDFLESYIDEVDVQTMSPAALVDWFGDGPRSRFDRAHDPRNPSGMDLLIIDAEGLDLQILQELLGLDAVRPQLIIYENVHLGPEGRSIARKLLESRGYLSVDCHGYNGAGIRTDR